MEKNKEIKRILDDRDDEENDDSTGKKRKFFCAKTFRKELHGNDRLKSKLVLRYVILPMNRL